MFTKSREVEKCFVGLVKLELPLVSGTFEVGIYRVTHQVVSNIPLTTKLMLHVNGRLETT